MKLDAIDQRSALWLRLSAHMRDQLGVLRRRNDGSLTHEETQHLRGRIAQCKVFLALQGELGNEGETAEAAPIQTDPYGVGFSRE